MRIVALAKDTKLDRDYALVTSPHADGTQVAVKRVGGRWVCTWINPRQSPEDKAPMRDFTWHEDFKDEAAQVLAYFQK